MNNDYLIMNNFEQKIIKYSLLNIKLKNGLQKERKHIVR